MTDVRILAKFTCADVSSVHQRLKVRLWDRDTVSDDMLAEAVPDNEGRVAFQFNLGSVSSLDSPAEIMPDLYMQVLCDDLEVFRTPVEADVNFLKRDAVTGLRDHLTQDLGSFQLPTLSALEPVTRRDFLQNIINPQSE